MTDVQNQHISPDQLEHYFDIMFASRDNGRFEESREYERNICTSYQDLFEQLQAERREEWREGIVNVLDHEGNYLGCMGSETWSWTLDGGIESMKEQYEEAVRLQLEARAQAVELKEQLEVSHASEQDAHAEAQRLKELYGEEFRAARENAGLREQLEALQTAVDDGVLVFVDTKWFDAYHHLASSPSSEPS